MASVRAVRWDDEHGLRALVGVQRAADPDRFDGVAEHRARAAGDPRAACWLAEEAGRAVGAALLQPVVYWDEPHWMTAEVWVAPERRGRGVGGALWRDLRDHATRSGLHGLRAFVREGAPHDLGFAMRRGFAQVETTQRVRLTLTQAPPPLEAPAGVRVVPGDTVPDLPAVLAALDAELVVDIPGVDADTYHAFTRDDWTRMLASTAHDPSATWIMVVDGQPAGYAFMRLFSEHPEVAHHEFTGIGRAARGRGLATLLKRTILVWAWSGGVRVLTAANDPDNAPMQHINAQLGFVREPDALAMRMGLP